MTFCVELKGFEVEEGVPVDLHVMGIYVTGGGNRRGHPDAWTQAWAEMVVQRIENAQGCPLPAAVERVLDGRADFRRAVELEILKRGPNDD